MLNDENVLRPSRDVLQRPNKNGVVISHNAVSPNFYCLNSLGWLMGLEPTTTGITILDSTN